MKNKKFIITIFNYLILMVKDIFINNHLSSNLTADFFDKSKKLFIVHN